MRSKPILLLAVALGCGTVAAFAATQVIKDQGKSATNDAVEILVASVDVANNTKISADKFQLEKWPRDRLPQGAIHDIKSVEGKYTNQRLYQGEPLLERKVNSSNESIAVKIPAGFKVFDLPVDATNGGVGYIQPGHRIDIHGFFEKGGALRESKSILVMENVEVLMVDGVATREQDEGNRKAATIQLLIRASQFEALNTAKNLGKLNVSLRPVSEQQDEPNEFDNGEVFLDWVKSAVDGSEAVAAKATPAPEVATPAVTPPTKPKKQMLIISPTGTESYAWYDDNEIPQKVDAAAPTNASNGLTGTPGLDPTSYQSPNAQGLTSGMVWDGKQWTYNPSGFKPVYPTADHDSTKKGDSNEQSAPPANSEPPAS